MAEEKYALLDKWWGGLSHCSHPYLQGNTMRSCLGAYSRQVVSILHLSGQHVYMQIVSYMPFYRLSHY